LRFGSCFVLRIFFFFYSKTPKTNQFFNRYKYFDTFNTHSSTHVGDDFDEFNAIEDQGK